MEAEGLQHRLGKVDAVDHLVSIWPGVQKMWRRPG